MATENHTHVFLERQVPDPAADDMVAGYLLIKRHTEALGFQHYSNFIEHIFCTPERQAELTECLARGVIEARSELSQKHFCFTGTKAYDQIREATDMFIACQVALSDDCCDGTGDHRYRRLDRDHQEHKLAEAKKLSTNIIDRRECYDMKLIEQRFEFHKVTSEQLRSMYRRLFNAPGGPAECCTDVPEVVEKAPAKKGAAEQKVVVENQEFFTTAPRPRTALTFMQQLMENQSGVPLKDCNLGSGNCSGLLLCKINCPPLLELIWSYWMEQGMLVQGINALALRFQNRRYPGHEPLHRCDISPLRPLNNIFWGYVQREPDRLTVARRAYEYDHHYGLRIRGAAVPPMAPADSRLRFIEAFHRLLQEANRYYRMAMDTTLNADAFPALNCLRELHLVLAEGAHNQFGDLPTTARAEMLIQQWILARPEVRDFLGGRPGVPYPQPWMPHMDTLRTMLNWNDASIRHYMDLANYGEQLLLSARYLPWSTVNNSTAAAAWLNFWRPEVQGYLHSYRAVTGVDLGAPEVPVAPGGLLTAQPADLIGRARMNPPLGAPR